MLGEIAATAALGLAIGLVGAIAASRALEGFLYGVGRIDPPTHAAVAALLMAAALLAAWTPARRAAAVDPVRALRAD